MIKANTNIISFNEIPALSEKSVRSVLLVRHSMRESLQNGNYDPALTPEGHSYAVECGKFLAGWRDVCCGASARRRTFDTVSDLLKGANISCEKITEVPEIYDAALFESVEEFNRSIDDGDIHELLRIYFETGDAPGMVNIKIFTEKLLDRLTSGAEKKNQLLASHDIVIVALLHTLGVHRFVQDDWCGYIHGAFLAQDTDGTWQVYYTVPDKENRKKYTLFI